MLFCGYWFNKSCSNTTKQGACRLNTNFLQGTSTKSDRHISYLKTKTCELFVTGLNNSPTASCYFWPAGELMFHPPSANTVNTCMRDRDAGRPFVAWPDWKSSRLQTHTVIFLTKAYWAYLLGVWCRGTYVKPGKVMFLRRVCACVCVWVDRPQQRHTPSILHSTFCIQGLWVSTCANCVRQCAALSCDYVHVGL